MGYQNYATKNAECGVYIKIQIKHLLPTNIEKKDIF